MNALFSVVKFVDPITRRKKPSIQIMYATSKRKTSMRRNEHNAKLRVIDSISVRKFINRIKGVYPKERSGCLHIKRFNVVISGECEGNYKR